MPVRLPALPRFARLVVVALVVTLVVACQGADPSPRPAPTTSAGPVVVTAAELLARLREAGLPVGATRCYTAADDPNGLLGQPGQYVDRCAWHDTRVADPYPEVTERDGPPTEIGGSVELFDRPDDAVARARYIESFDPVVPVAEHHWVVPDGGIVLLRVSGRLTRAQAETYLAALRGALPPGPMRATLPSPTRVA